MDILVLGIIGAVLIVAGIIVSGRDNKKCNCCDCKTHERDKK